jgi:hypothetical protein
MKKTLLLLATILLISAPARADIINFDDVANGTVVDTHYAGITFLNPLGGSAFARDAFSLTNTGNVVSVFSTSASPTAPFNGSYGAVDGVFDSAVGRVSVDVTIFLNSGDMLGTSPLNAYMQLFNGTTVLATIYDTLAIGSGGSATQTLSYTSATDNITSVRLSAQHDPTGNSGLALFAEFDNLSYDARLASGSFPSTGVINPVRGGGGDEGGTPVPEPSTLVFLTSALAVVIPSVRKRRNSFQ